MVLRYPTVCNLYTFLGFLFICKFSVSNKEDFNQNSVLNTTESEPALTGEEESSGEGMALVLYDDSKVLHMYREKRTFTFGDEEVVINQDWSGGGVAAIVWDAAVVLGEYLSTHVELVKDKNVLELGAGTGLTGIVAARKGAKVTITDREVALKALTENVQANLESESDTLNIEIKELDWGANHRTFTEEYDTIIGADIIYIEETFQQLLETVVFLCKPKTVILLSCRIRYERDNRFLDMVREYLLVEKLFYDSPRDVFIYSVRRLKEEL